MTTILALRAAVRSVLAAGGFTIVDEARNVAMPYASFGDGTTRIWTDGITNFGEHRLTLHVWSRASGDAEALDLAGRMAARVEQSKPALDGAMLLHWTVSGQEIGRPTSEGVRRATLRLTALTESKRGDSP